MILVAGSANLDFVVRASHIPAPGETVLGREFLTFPGGKGANQAIACARAGGCATEMLLALGDDPFAAPIEDSLKAAGVRMHVVRVRNEPTGTAFICVSDDAENAITVAPGANSHLHASHLPPLDGFTHLLLQLETPIETVTAYARAARARGVKVVLNAAPARALPPELLLLVDVLVVNMGELAAVSGFEGSTEQCLEHVDVPCVVVTLGDRGCCARVGSELIMQSAFAVMPVDTTAAGDAFCGVLVASLSQSLQFADALRRANAAGALACTRPGAQSSIPTQAELESFLGLNRRRTANS
ncbi:MAG: ribokinase [Steroidobacteraceae bacterium]|nr:ribokinase [Steroidobacteraceae bacterium]MBM2854854.1 ribokinase [Steroidobacteraceae bacterium]